MSMSENLKILVEERNSRLQGLSLAVSGYGLAAIRGIFVLNGSAAVAVLTKQSTITPEGKYIVWLCATGAMLAVLCSGVSFVAQWFKKESFLDSSLQGLISYQTVGRSEVFTAVKYQRHGRVAFGAAMILFLLSASCFACAVFSLVDIL